MKRVICLLALAVLAPVPAVLRACDIPVFRYALELWMPDEYEVLVLHDAPLTGEQAAAVTVLSDAASGPGRLANIRIVIVDVSKKVPAGDRPLYESVGRRALPCIALRFPEGVRQERVLWHRPLTAENARMLLDSPLRRKIAEHILAGDAGVWVLRESGNRERDDAAANVLSTALGSWKYLYLSPEERTRAQMQDAPVGRETKFSLLRMPRGEIGDPLLEALFLRVEPDLQQYADQPMAFPIYGRGRVLYAIVGKGITVSNIQKACQFVTGDCSCEVKALNPGLDLIMTTDWRRGIGESWLPLADASLLTGLPASSAAREKGTAPPASASTETAQPAESSRSSSPLRRNIVVAFVLVAVAGVTLAVGFGINGKRI